MAERSGETVFRFAWRSLATHGRHRVPPRARGFTLIELILVMTLLVIGVSFVTPQLAGFFRGRTMQAEARRLISLTHNGAEPGGFGRGADDFVV